MVVGSRLSCCWWYVLQNIVRFKIKFATCIHGNEQRVAFSTFEYIRTHFALALTTFKVTFVFTTMSPLNAWVPSAALFTLHDSFGHCAVHFYLAWVVVAVPDHSGE